MKDLYMDAAVVVGEDIYFTTGNTVGLYKLSGEKISLVTSMYTRVNNIKKFAGLVYYKGKIWMIPMKETDLFIYDLKNNEFNCINMSGKYIKSSKGVDCFRRPIQDGNNIWLIPYYYNAIIKINMDSFEITEYDSWPEGVVVNCNKSNFKTGAIDNGKLYLFKDGANKNIVLDVITGEMKVWDIDEKEKFGTVKNGITYIAPVKKGDSIYIYDSSLESGIKSIGLPDSVWGNAENYEYWHVDVVEDNIIILPLYAEGIWLIDAKSKIRRLEVKSDAYMSLVDYHGFAGYEAMKYKGNVLLIPYSGNTLFFITSDFEIKILKKLAVSDDIKCDELSPFLKYVVSDVGKDERCYVDEQNLVGEKIYKMLKEESCVNEKNSIVGSRRRT